ncbi:unnamed protein product [Rotaria sordida]|uniref:Fatty acyl-CoA reductase n=1 Tax=Rotaria sordida TaxID=392033 RepID=A0A814WYQ7_9BILA|nr:unnamed protein product [Rotaria sordida]
MASSNNNTSAISRFFNGKSVFITGATGFIGKQIIEKLLRSCPGIDNIYILIRSKRGAHVHERVQQLCSLALFDKVRLLTPNFKSKIIPIIGDLTKANLDLTNEDEQTLIEHCHIIINSGASIRFHEPLKQSIKANVYSVQNIINLCKKMKQLQSFVHISTAYIHCYRTDMTEVIYPMNDNPNTLLESLEYFDDQMFNHLSERLAKQYPNNYAYTKSLAEYLLLKQGNSLPIAIVRPSIVGAAWKEPIPGWIDSYTGVTSIIAAIGKRLIRVAFTSPTVDLPIIPVDVVANMTVAVAWITATNNNSLSTPTVYNCCTGKNIKTYLTVEDFFRILATETTAIGFENYSIIGPSVTTITNKPYYCFRYYTDEVVPAYMMDIIAYLTFKKPKMVKLQEKISYLKLSLEYFAQNQWIFANQNSQLLQSQMNDFDRQEFSFNLTELNWPSYIRNYCIGIKKYLLKEDLQQSSIKKSSKYSFIKAKKIRHLLSILFFFAVTWLMRQTFLRRLRIIWRTLNLIIRSYLQQDKKKIICSLN